MLVNSQTFLPASLHVHTVIHNLSSSPCGIRSDLRKVDHAGPKYKHTAAFLMVERPVFFFFLLFFSNLIIPGSMTYMYTFRCDGRCTLSLNPIWPYTMTLIRSPLLSNGVKGQTDKYIMHVHGRARYSYQCIAVYDVISQDLSNLLFDYSFHTVNRIIIWHTLRRGLISGVSSMVPDFIRYVRLSFHISPQMMSNLLLHSCTTEISSKRTTRDVYKPSTCLTPPSHNLPATPC